MVAAASFILLSVLSVSLGSTRQVIQPRTVLRGAAVPDNSVFPPISPKQSVSCGGNYAVTQTGVTGVLDSPNYSANYPAGSNCKYSVSSPTGTTMTVSCTNFAVPCTDGFYISTSGDSTLQQNSFGFCGTGTVSKTTTGNKLYMELQSSASSTGTRTFRCQITASSTTSAPSATTQAPATTPAPTTSSTTVATTAKPATAPPATTQAPAPATTPAGGAGASTCQCGTKYPQTRIVGGTDAAPGEFPWRVLVFPYDPATGSGGVCGGTIISPNWIITAAHCTADMKSGNLINVYVNTTSNPVTTGSRSTMIVADRYVQHPMYSSSTMDNDLTLVHLSKPITMGKYVMPICLPFSLVNANLTKTTVQASGFGTTQAVPVNTENNSAPSDTLRRVDLPVLTTPECQKYLGTTITNNMLCTYLPGKDTCQGDSGGSIDYTNPANGRATIVGVTSFGMGCAQTGYPGVYAKVSNYLPWIQSTTGETFCNV